jgi:hypothetical protein
MPDKKTKVEWTNFNSDLCEGVSTGLEFAYVTKDGVQCSQFCHCKDYLQDAIWGLVNKKSCEVYGFRYKAKAKLQPTLAEMRVVVVNQSDQKLREKIPASLDFMNQIEEALGMTKKSTATECENAPLQYTKGGAWLFVSSKRFLQSPVMISLYTLLIRTGFSHTLGTPFMDTINGVRSGKIVPYSSVDKGYWGKAIKGFERILKHGDRKIFYKDIGKNFSRKVEPYTIHNDSGIVSFSQEATKSNFPHWHREEVV